MKTGTSVIPENVKRSILASHALTGSDSTNQFAGISKVCAWKVFLKHPDLIKELERYIRLNEDTLL